VVAVEHVTADARVMVRGYQGRRIAWLASRDGGGVETTTLYTDIFEVPRMPLAQAREMGLGETPEEIAARLERDLDFEAVKLVVWPEVPAGLNYGPFPEAIGVALIDHTIPDRLPPRR
jgi:hypothetical protein